MVADPYAVVLELIDQFPQQTTVTVDKSLLRAALAQLEADIEARDFDAMEERD